MNNFPFHFTLLLTRQSISAVFRAPRVLPEHDFTIALAKHILVEKANFSAAGVWTDKVFTSVNATRTFSADVGMGILSHLGYVVQALQRLGAHVTTTVVCDDG